MNNGPKSSHLQASPGFEESDDPPPYSPSGPSSYGPSAAPQPTSFEMEPLSGVSSRSSSRSSARRQGLSSASEPFLKRDSGGYARAPSMSPRRPTPQLVGYAAQVPMTPAAAADVGAGRPGCCCSTQGGCCCSDSGGCFCSSGGGCCCSDHGGFCCSDHGGCWCSDNEGCCCTTRPGV